MSDLDHDLPEHCLWLHGDPFLTPHGKYHDVCCRDPLDQHYIESISGQAFRPLVSMEKHSCHKAGIIHERFQNARQGKGGRPTSGRCSRPRRRLQIDEIPRWGLTTFSKGEWEIRVDRAGTVVVKQCSAIVWQKGKVRGTAKSMET
jgi:hypothetical protein